MSNPNYDDDEEEREERRPRRQSSPNRRTIVLVVYFSVLCIATICLCAFVFMYIGQNRGHDDSASTVASLVNSSTQPSSATQPAASQPASSQPAASESAAESQPEGTEAVATVPSSSEAAPSSSEVAPSSSEVASSSNSALDPSNPLSVPSWVTPDIIAISDKNRPGIALDGVNNIVIHWVANPGSTAKDNRDYFNDLANPAANPTGTSASAHFVVGLSGEIVQVIPINEVAYANYPRNNDTISIEVCHPDWEGKYTDTTYWTLIRLTSWLCEKYNLTSEDVIRHFDVSGKDCPKYYVENNDAWLQLKENVKNYMLEHPDISSEMP